VVCSAVCEAQADGPGRSGQPRRCVQVLIPFASSGSTKLGNSHKVAACTGWQLWSERPCIYSPCNMQTCSSSILSVPLMICVADRMWVMSWLAHHPDFANATAFSVSTSLSAFGSSSAASHSEPGDCRIQIQDERGCSRRCFIFCCDAKVACFSAEHVPSDLCDHSASCGES